MVESGDSRYNDFFTYSFLLVNWLIHTSSFIRPITYLFSFFINRYRISRNLKLNALKLILGRSILFHIMIFNGDLVSFLVRKYVSIKIFR